MDKDSARDAAHGKKVGSVAPVTAQKG